MTTIVDALIVTLGLDGTKFKAGSKTAAEDMHKLGSDAERAAKLLEAKGKQAAQFYAKIRNEVVALGAAYLGTRAIKNFAEDTIASAASLGMMAKNLDIGTEKLSAWQRANERAGGSAEGMTAQLLESQAAAAKYSMGMVDESMQWFYRMGGADTALRDGNSYLMARADIIAKLYKTDPGRAQLVAQQMGISPEQFNLLKQGSAGVLALVAAQEKNSAITKEGAARALELRNKILDLRDRLAYTATTILLRLAPAIERVADKLQGWANWIADHKDDISKWVENAVKAVGEFIAVIDKAAQSIGGWKNVLVALAALKVLSMIGGLISLATALGAVGTGLGAIAGGAAGVGVLSAIGGAAGTAALAVGALTIAVAGMGAVLTALDSDTDAQNHPGKRRVRVRGKKDEWVTDPKLSQEHAGEHFQRMGRGGSWVKDTPPPVPTETKISVDAKAGSVDKSSVLPEAMQKVLGAGVKVKVETVNSDPKDTGTKVPGWLQRFFGGTPAESQPGGRSRPGTPRGGAPAPIPAKPSASTAASAAPVSQVVAAPVQSGDLIAVTRKLIALGWTQQQAAGIAGSLQQESNLDPAARNPESGAYGIGQWLGSRVADFKKFSGKELVGSSLEDQLKFQQYELTKGNERPAGDKLRATKTAEDAARIHSEAYERPGDDEANIARRQLNAALILQRLQTDNALAAANIPQQAADVTTNTTRSTTTSTTTNETKFTGPVTINTQATDAKGIAKAFATEVSKYGFVPQANTGMQ